MLIITLMSHCLPRLSILLLIGALFYPVMSQGASLYLKNGSEFSLNIERVKTNLDINNDRIENRASRIYAAFYEPAYPWFKPGLKLGYISASQNNNPVSAGKDLTGELIGLSMRSINSSGQFFNPQLQLDYIYNIAKNDSTGQDLTQKWFEFTLKAGISFNTKILSLALGGYHFTIDGDEQASGTINHTYTIKQDKQTGSYLDFTLYVDATGKVGVHAEGGSRKGLNLIFSRNF